MASTESPRLGSNVFILGAGASVHAGIPLLADFIGRARSLLMSGHTHLQYEDSFRAAFEWIGNLRQAGYYVDLKVDNLEHVFSLAQLAKEAGQDGASEIYESLRLLILETIDQSCALKCEKGSERAAPDGLYRMFFRTLLDEIGGRKALARPPVPCDPIITFNYDVLLDNVMFMQNMTPAYGFGKWQHKRWPAWPLYKLHGSLNWAAHAKCPQAAGREIQLLEPVPLPQGLDEMPRGDAQLLPLRMATRNMRQKPCPGCGKTDVRTPALIPPTWSKSPSEARIGQAWTHAVDAISKATQIIIIGYSLPETDAFFPYLLALGLQRNSQIRRILVVNPAKDSEATQARYERAFAQVQTDRGFLQYWPITFDAFVRGGVAGREDLADVLHFADVPSRP